MLVPRPPQPDVKGFRFSLALPLGQLVFCAILLWPTRARIFAEFGVPQRLLSYISLPHEDVIAGELRVCSPPNALETAAMLNLPAGMLQLPYAIFSPNHGELHPPGVDFRIWRAATWPILGTFFWWLAGRGAEAIAAAQKKRLIPRIRWAEATLGFVLLASGVTLAVGFVLTAGEDRHDRLLQVLVSTGLFWAFLGALPFTAKIMQWRLRKKLVIAS